MNTATGVSGAVSPRRHRSWLRLGVRALPFTLLLAALCAMQLAVQLRSHPPAPDPRRQIVDSASMLLQGAQANGPVRNQPRDEHLRATEVLETLREFAHENAGEPPQGPARDSGLLVAALETRKQVPAPPERQASTHVDASVEVLAPPAMPRIPDRIEGKPPALLRADALSNLTVSGTLRMLDAEDAPFSVQSVRTGPGPARVQIHLRNTRTDDVARNGWFEVGEAPLPGWRIVQITAKRVVALTPLGNPMRFEAHGDAH